MSDTETPAFEGWVVIEMLGRRRLAGWLTETQIGGASFLRLDVPGAEGAAAATQFYSPAAVYAITPTNEDTARQVAQLGRPAPVQRWELPPAPAVDTRDAWADDLDRDDEEDAPL
jgi:hypothetical protein